MVSTSDLTADDLVRDVVRTLEAVRRARPLVLQLSNIVVTNDQANVTLAVGASPIMSLAVEEQEDLAEHIDGLLVNIGTVNAVQLTTMLAAGEYASARNTPTILDPVGVGASRYRQSAVQQLLKAWRPALIKGNAGEIGFLAGGHDEARSRGVDSEGVLNDPARLVRDLARREDSVVVLHGAVDWISDGETVVKLSNGSHRLAEITGTGCMAGSIIASCCGVAGITAVCIASELAAERTKVRGAVSFKAAWMDELGFLTGDHILDRARIEIVEV